MSNALTQASRVPNNLRLRRTFGRIKKIIDIPNLIEIQRRSYEEFLQKDVAPESRRAESTPFIASLMMSAAEPWIGALSAMRSAPSRRCRLSLVRSGR